MKRNRLLLLLALLMTAATGAWAQGPWTSGDCTATLSGGTLTISGNGAMADYTKIGNRPWNSYINSITSVVVEPGVTHIGRQAFLQFMNMTSVTLNEGLLTIGDNAFGGCNNASFTSITIPASVTSIGASIFSGCDNLATVTIADGSNLTTIGKSTFSGCLGLSSIEIPAGVTSIGNNAFNNCTNLATVTIPAGVTTIGNYAFQNCSALGSITLPAGVTSIGQNAFYGCTALATITLNSNPSIDANAFYGISPAVTMNLTATPAGGANWTTFYNQNYGFEADANTEVFKVVLSGTALTLNKVDNGIVDAGTAVVLKTTGGNPVMTLTTSASSDTQDNSLTGVSAAAGATSDGTFYVLDNGASGLGFYKLASGGNVPVGNAYLTSDSQNDFLSIGGGSDPAEPSTYTVSFAKNTEDADNWTGKAGDATVYQKLPLEGVAEGAALTLKYDGTKKVKSVKAVKKAEAPHLVIEDKNNYFGIGNQKFYFTEGETWTEAMANHPENAAAGWVLDGRLRFKPDVYGYAIFILRSGDYYTIEDAILNQPIDTSKTYMFEGTSPT